MKPSIGRIVHYVAYGTPGGEFPSGVCRAATITEICIGAACVEKEEVAIFVMNPSGVFFNNHIPHDEETKKPGSWHWPERVE